MRGIGIQISRLEMCRTKQAKSSLINFFNKTKKLQQTCDKMLEDGKKDLYVSNENSKSDCPKVPLTTESLAMNKICEINHFSSESIKSSESINVAIPVNVEIEPSTFVAKPKHKKLHNLKANENIKVKDLLGKSNKKAIQRQTSQENFFKQVKPNSGRSSKYEIPRIQDIDMSVLIELPADIRNEIFDEYKRNKKQAAMNTANTIDPVNEEVPHDRESSNVQNYSQVDPDVLSALMENDLHPDVQRDVQMYCDMKREANRVNFKETNERSDSERLQETDAKINDNKENAFIVNSTYTNKVECILQENAIHAGNQLYEKDDTVEATSTLCQINSVNTSHNNVTNFL